MESYYTSPSYYYQPSCPLHDSYVDPCCTHPPQSTPSHCYPSYVDQSSPQIVHYNNSTSPVQTVHSIRPLNSTFELAPPVGRRRRQRTVFSKDQVVVLDQIFEKNQYPDIQLREQLSQRLDVPEVRIQVWFKNRRSRARTTHKTKY
ncbi:unnamed protein product [Rotaria socialis]|uniref:Homeobox domain-containing protein n=2 Tax=Rotaria socialis TaxID=392032 RepID=A0A818VY66_9BILA|nr:unnamed protein product [Rotaria socialis]